MEILCKRCGEMCEFAPEEGGYMTWCNTCNDYPDADIDAANREHYAQLIDYVCKVRKEQGYENPSRNED
jgi:hypothetical protein